MEIAVWLVEAIGFREGRIALNSHRIEARRDLRERIFLMVCARMRFRKQDRRRLWLRSPSTPRGFRYAQRRVHMVRLSTRGSALKSYTRMRNALDDLERIVERAIARVPKSLSTGQLALCAPPAIAPAFKSPAWAAEGADTS